MKKLTGHLYFWVLLAILIGGTFAYLSPTDAVKRKPLGDGFIALAATLVVAHWEKELDRDAMNTALKS